MIDTSEDKTSSCSHGLTVQYAGTDIRKYSFAVRVVEPRNRHPNTLKKAASMEALKMEWRHLRKKIKTIPTVQRKK
jgi:hypothetical protein